MKVFNIIKSAKYYIGKLNEGLARMHSDKQKSFQIDMINSFIELVNAAELLTNSNNQNDIIESLLLARIYDQLESQEYRSMNWSQNVFVVEQSADNNLQFIGAIPTDAIVQANHIMQSDDDVKELGLEVNAISQDKLTEGNLDVANAKKLIEYIYANKTKTLDMRSVVNEIDFDVTHHPTYHLERIAKELQAKDIDRSITKDVSPVDVYEWQKQLRELLEGFKITMQWK